jgi:hypothetical protein
MRSQTFRYGDWLLVSIHVHNHRRAPRSQKTRPLIDALMNAALVTVVGKYCAPSSAEYRINANARAISRESYSRRSRPELLAGSGYWRSNPRNRRASSRREKTIPAGSIRQRPDLKRIMGSSAPKTGHTRSRLRTGRAPFGFDDCREQSVFIQRHHLGFRPSCEHNYFGGSRTR